MTIERDLPDGPCHLRVVFNALSIAGALPDSRIGDSVDFSYTVTTAHAPAVLSLADGALPPGLSMDATGRIEGQVTTAGVYSWVIRGVDAFGYVREISDGCTVAPIELAGHLADCVVGDAVDYTYTALGGVVPVSLDVASGALPDGLSMDDSGRVTGTTTTLGRYAWSIEALDANGNTATLADSNEVRFSGFVDAPDTDTGTPCGRTPYSHTYTVSGGTSPYTYAITSGSLPPGITLASTGVLSGPATAVANADFTVTVTDASSIAFDYADSIKVTAQPEAMVCTWNPLDKSSTIVLSNGDMTASVNGSGLSNERVRSNSFRVTGKVYFEVFVVSGGTYDNTSPNIGVCNCGSLSTFPLGGANGGWAYLADGRKYLTGIVSGYGSSYKTGDTIGVAIDVDASKLWFSKNNVWQARGNPAAGTGAATSSMTGPVYAAINIATGDIVDLHAKASSLTYAPPAGFTAWDMP